MGESPTVLQILDNASMARYQDPKIQTSKGPRPYYFIRPVVKRPNFTSGDRTAKQEVIRLGFADELKTKALREAAKARIMAEINDPRHFAASQMPLGKLVEAFREKRMPQLSSSTVAKYDSHLRNHISGWSHYQLCEIQPAELEGWINRLKLGSAAKQDVLHLFSALFETARRWRLFQGANPCRDVLLGRAVPAREKFIPTQQEIKKLLDALECCPSVTHGIAGPDVALMVRVAIASGWRISEVLGLRHDAIDGESIIVKRRWHRGDLAELPKTTAGGRRNWIGPLAKELAARGGEFVFQAAEGVPPDDRDLNQHILRPCAVAVGLYREGFGFHSFRRLNISWKQEAGATPVEAAKGAGHSRTDMTMRYSVVDDKRERAQVNKVLRRVQ